MQENIDIASMKTSKMISNIMLVFGVIIGSTGVVIRNNESPLIGYLIIIVGFGIAFVAGLINRKSDTLFKEQVLIPTIRNIFPNSNFWLSVTDTRVTEAYKEVGLLNQASGEDISNYLVIDTGEHRLDEFSVNAYNMTAVKGVPKKMTVFEGTQLRYDYGTKIDGIVRILSSSKGNKNFLTKQCALTPEQIYTGNLEFDEKFEVLASSQHIGFYVLNSTVIEKLNFFVEKYGEFGLAITPGEIMMSFKGQDRFIHLPKKSSDINEHMFDNARKDLFEIVEMLNDIGNAISKHKEKEDII